MFFTLKILFCLGLAFPLIPGSQANQLYLQPAKSEGGYFTNDSFFITCLTTEETIDQLSWTGPDDNSITSTEGRIHIQQATGGQKGLELVVETVQKGDAGRYVCSDMTNSVSFNLMVYSSVSFGNTPRVQHSPEGESARLVCHVTADPTPTVNWYYNASKIVNSTKYQVEQDGLLIHDITRSDAGIYKCKGIVITHLTAQVRELDIDFQVHYAPEWVQGESDVVYASFDAEANITCSANANPEPMFQWMKDDGKIYNSSDHMILNSGKESVLRFKVSELEQFGEYVCIASNTIGNQEKVIHLKEGNAPEAPTMELTKEVEGTVIFKIKESQNSDNELKVTGFRVQYVLTSEPWDQADSQDFNIGEKYMLRNLSYNSDYVFRASARNAAGYGAYSDEVKYTTHRFEVAPVVGDSGSIVFGSLSLLLLMLAASLLMFN